MEFSLVKTDFYLVLSTRDEMMPAISSVVDIIIAICNRCAYNLQIHHGYSIAISSTSPSSADVLT